MVLKKNKNLNGRDNCKFLNWITNDNSSFVPIKEYSQHS